MTNNNRYTLKRKNNKKIKNNKSIKRKYMDYKCNKLNVSRIHTIVYYDMGNIKGEPVIVLSGGPGEVVGNPKKLSKLFDMRRYHIIMVEQRGIGKSRPLGELKSNTTNDLVEDIEMVRKDLISNYGDSKSKIDILGMSWGSYVGLSYSIKYPCNVKRLVLRSVFLCSKEEFNDIENGDLYKKIHPDYYDKYSEGMKGKKSILENYIESIEKGSKDKMRRFLDFESNTVSMYPYIGKKKSKLSNDDMLMSKLQAHYFKNECFYKDMLSKNNMERMKDIDVIIINGRYDLSTPAYYAYRLHKMLPNSLIYLTVAGHSLVDKENWEIISEIYGGNKNGWKQISK